MSSRLGTQSITHESQCFIGFRVQFNTHLIRQRLDQEEISIELVCIAAGTASIRKENTS